MSDWQCSHCFQIYNFDDFMKLKYEWVDPKQKQKYGKRAVCKCGKPFHKDKWQMKTEIEGYTVSTVHLELCNQNMSDFSDDRKMWYETMIHDSKPKIKDEEWLSFQARYETKTEAIKGHELACKLLPKIILHPEKYPQGIIDVFIQAIGNKGMYKPKK